MPKGQFPNGRKFEHLPHTTALEPLIRAPCLRCGIMMTTTKYVRRCCICHNKEKMENYMVEAPIRIYSFGTYQGRKK